MSRRKIRVRTHIEYRRDYNKRWQSVYYAHKARVHRHAYTAAQIRRFCGGYFCFFDECICAKCIYELFYIRYHPYEKHEQIHYPLHILASSNIACRVVSRRGRE